MALGHKTGGRLKGTPNKIAAGLRELAGVHTEAALATLAHIMEHGQTEQARVSAARELLDRAHGRAPQAITGADGGVFAAVIQVVTGVDRGDPTD